MEHRYLIAGALCVGIVVVFLILRSFSKKDRANEQTAFGYVRVAARYAGFDEASINAGSYPTYGQVFDGIETEQVLLVRRAKVLHERLSQVDKADGADFLLATGPFFDRIREGALRSEKELPERIDFLSEHLVSWYEFASSLEPQAIAAELKAWVNDAHSWAMVILGFYKDIVQNTDRDRKWIGDE